MKISFTPHKIKKKLENQVTSSNIFKKNQRKVSDDYKFDDEGLFSQKIFGRFNHCECGELNEPGFCQICKTRVVDPKNLPDYYIDLGVKVPKLYADFRKFPKAKKLLTYQAFLYDDKEIIDFDINTEISEYDTNKVKIGVEAAQTIYNRMGAWMDKYLVDFVSVPHPAYRPNLRLADGKIKISDVNKNLVDILYQLELINEYKDMFENQTNNEFIFYLLAFYNEIYTRYETFQKKMFYNFTNDNKSFLRDNMRAHRVTGAIKGTVVNRFDIDEDVVLIGDTFIQTLYPLLYKDCGGDMEEINNHLIKTDARVLLNRPPTIGHLSIIGMKPRVASCYKFGTFKDGALGPNKQSEYDDEIDTIGIRTIAVNPLIQDALAGDYDGDCYLVIALYSKKAQDEADVMLPSKNFMEYANGEIRNKILEDVEFIDGVPIYD